MFTIKCYPCNIGYKPGRETHVELYSRCPWLDHYTSQCPKCKQTITVWYLISEVLNEMAKNPVPGDQMVITVTEFAPDSIHQAYCRMNSRPNYSDHYVSSRAQAHINAEAAFAAWELENGERV
jgi:hypothetical protein